MKALATLVLALAAGAGGSAHAADSATLARVHERLALAAGPWCDRAAELGTDGQRRCTLRVLVVEAEQANAAQFADTVLLLRPLLEALDEPTLAVALGHEIAHLVLGHGRRRLAAGHPDTPADPKAQELDADALGLLLAMRAGYPATAGARLFESVPHLPGWGPASDATHPAPPDRAAALREVARQACATLAAGAPLMPQPVRLLPLAEHRRDEALAAPGARPPDAVCEAASDAGPAAAAAARAPRNATPFASPFTLGRHAPDGPCPHCDPR